MSYRFTTVFDSTTYFVPCGVSFLTELADAVDQNLIDVTNLGQKGNSLHSPNSRHSPHPYDGKLWIAAFDLGGRDYPRVADFWQAMFRAGDPRINPHGFCQWGDGYGLAWPGGGREWTGKDQGHMHGDFAMKHDSIGGISDNDWWVPALGRTDPWHFIHWLKTGQVIPLGAADPIETEHLGDDMAAVPQSEWNTARDQLKTLAAVGAAATEARRLGEVILRKRPPRPGELVPALPAGEVDVMWRRGLGVNEKLAPGDKTWSPEGRYVLSLEAGGNLVLRNDAGAAVWSTGPKGGTSLVMQGDGNLVMYGPSGAKWHTGTAGKPGSVLAVQDDGNLTVRLNGTAVWARTRT